MSRIYKRINTTRSSENSSLTNGEEKHFARSDAVKQVGNVGKDGLKNLLLGDSKGGGALGRVTAVVDDAIHVQVQVVKGRKASGPIAISG